MNAGTDVERSIAQWLAEESPGRAPDRILANAAETIDRTKQRRFAVAWREPVSISLRGFAAMAVIVVIAIAGAGWIGRSTASVGAQSSPTPASTPRPTARVATLAEYKTARDALCDAAWPQRQALDDRIGSGLTDPSTPQYDRTSKLFALEQEMDFEHSLYSQILALDLPPDMASDQAAWSANVSGIFAIVQQEIELINNGKYAEAAAVDLTTNPLARAAESFETKYDLKPCP
jgi:hypothetical protein